MRGRRDGARRDPGVVGAARPDRARKDCRLEPDRSRAWRSSPRSTPRTARTRRPPWHGPARPPRPASSRSSWTTLMRACRSRSCTGSSTRFPRPPRACRKRCLRGRSRHPVWRARFRGSNGFDAFRRANTPPTPPGYRGPAPPPGKPHHYTFTVYALDAPLEVAEGLNKAGLLKAMEGHVIGQGQLVGLYERKAPATPGH